MDVPRSCRYTRDHFWVLPGGNDATIGVSDIFQEELGGVLFVDLPEVDDEIESLGTFGVIESENAVSDLIAPVSGTVVQVNGDLESSPELINEDPYGEGWLIRVQLDDPEQVESLLAPEEYEEYISGLDEQE